MITAKLSRHSVIVALHHAVKHRDHISVQALLDNLTTDKRLQFLFKADSNGVTALHEAAVRGCTEAVHILLNNLTPEQRLKFLSTRDIAGNTALRYSALNAHVSPAHLETKTVLEQYYEEAERIVYRKFVKIKYKL